MAKRIQAHNGTHGLRAFERDGKPVLGVSRDPCEELMASLLHDGDHDEVTDGNEFERFMASLMGATSNNDLMVQYINALKAGDHDEALRILREHDETTGEMEPGGAEEEAQLESDLAAASIGDKV